MSRDVFVDFESLARALENAQRDVALARLGRAALDEDADDETGVFADHSFVIGASAIDLLGEIRERNVVDPLGHAALSGHIARLLDERTYGAMRARMRATPSRILEVDERGATVRELLSESLAEGRPERLRLVDAALGSHAGRIAEALHEARAQCEEGSRKLRQTHRDDADAVAEGVDARARALLDATDDLADEVVAYLGSRSPGRWGIGRLGRALRARELDDVVPDASRARRTASWLRRLGVAGSLERGASVAGVRCDLAQGAEVVFPTVNTARILVSSVERGIGAEISMLVAVGRALAVLGANPGTPSYLRRPRRGITGRTLGALFVRAAFDRTTLAELRTTPANVLDNARRVAASCALLRLRIDAARVLVARGASRDAALARATRFEWDAGSAALVCAGANEDAEFDAARAGFAWTTALRERYDEDFFRHPSASEWMGSVLARASIASPLTFDLELSTQATEAAELRAFFDGRLP